MKLSDAANIAQLVIAVATVAGIIAALMANRMTLREVQRDRDLRESPLLVFERGGMDLEVAIIEAGLAIPGVNPSAVREIFNKIPKNAKTIRLRKPELYGQLKNLGAGPALEVRVQWTAEEIHIGSELFRIDADKAKEPLYASELNTMPTMSVLLAPGESTQLTRLPTFIVMDVGRKITEVSGILTARCSDVTGSTHISQQEFWLSTAYNETPPHVHVTFLDIQGYRSVKAREKRRIGLLMLRSQAHEDSRGWSVR